MLQRRGKSRSSINRALAPASVARVLMPVKHAGQQLPVGLGTRSVLFWAPHSSESDLMNFIFLGMQRRLACRLSQFIVGNHVFVNLCVLQGRAG
jgi:hypothetical protein